MIRDWLRRWLGIEPLERSLDDLWLREVNRQAAPVEPIPQAWVLSDEEQAKAERTLRRRSSGSA